MRKCLFLNLWIVQLNVKTWMALSYKLNIYLNYKTQTIIALSWVFLRQKFFLEIPLWNRTEDWIFSAEVIHSWTLIIKNLAENHLKVEETMKNYRNTMYKK